MVHKKCPNNTNKSGYTIPEQGIIEATQTPDRYASLTDFNTSTCMNSNELLMEQNHHQMELKISNILDDGAITVHFSQSVRCSSRKVPKHVFLKIYGPESYAFNQLCCTWWREPFSIVKLYSVSRLRHYEKLEGAIVEY